MHSKPVHLFHGSPKYVKYLQPTQGIGDGLTDNALGIYATANKQIAQLFSIQYIGLDKDARFNIKFEENKVIYVELYHCVVDWSRCGYVYTLPSETFVKIDDMQWLSTRAVTPLMIEQVNPLDLKEYIHQR